MYWIYVGTDGLGSFPWLRQGDEALPQYSVRWRLLARTDDPELAAVLMQHAREECNGSDRGRMRMAGRGKDILRRRS